MKVTRSALAVNTSMGNGNVARPTVISKREFLGEWSVPYPIEGYELNPGIQDTFLYAPRIARNFEEYHVDMFEIEVVSTCSAVDAGMCTIAVDKDPLDIAPFDEAHMETRTYWKTGPIRESMKMRLDPKLIHDAYGRLYVRHGTVENSDLKTYDFGKLYVCATGPAKASAFRIYLNYQFSFYAPNVEDDLSVEVALPPIGEPSPHDGVVPWRIDQMIDSVPHILKLLTPRQTTAVGTTLPGWSNKWSPVWQAVRNFEGILRIVGSGYQKSTGDTTWSRHWGTYVNSTSPDANYHQVGVYSGDSLGPSKWMAQDFSGEEVIETQGLAIPSKWNAGDYVTLGGPWDTWTNLEVLSALSNSGKIYLEPKSLSWMSSAQEQNLVLDKLLSAANATHAPLSSSSTTVPVKSNKR